MIQPKYKGVYVILNTARKDPAVKAPKNDYAEVILYIGIDGLWIVLSRQH